MYSVLKLLWVNHFLVICLFAHGYILQTNADNSSTFILINPNLSDASSLICHEDHCRGIVDLAISCHGDTDCLAMYYNNTVMSCMMCTCPAEPYHANRHNGTLEAELLVIERPRMKTGVWGWIQVLMMKLSNGNVFRVTGRLCGNSPATGELPVQRSVSRSFDVFLDLRLNKRLNKQSWGLWFETPSRTLWRHGNVGVENKHAYRSQDAGC